MTTTRLTLPAELLLLAHDPRSGRPLVDGQRLRAGLAGAALLELALDGALVLDETHRRARLRATGRPAQPSLAAALHRADGYAPKTAVARIGAGQTLTDWTRPVRDAAFAELERAGAGRRVDQRLLWVVPRTRWVEHDPGARADVVSRLSTILSGGARADERTASLVSVTFAVGLLGKVVPGLDAGQVRRRARQISEEGWGGAAVSRALSELQTAVVTAAVVSTTAATAGS